MRRSSRVPITLPIAVTSLEPSAPFSEICETLVVSAHGCAIFSPAKLEAGIPVQFRRKGGGATKAHVVDCRPMGSGQNGWQVAAKLDQPENFWGLEVCPEDWGRLMEIHSDDPQPTRKLAGNKNQPGAPGLKIVSDKNQPQLTERDLRAIVAEFVQPLHAEVVALREKTAQEDGKRSRFDISLSHIPPEVEEKLWVRLREDLGTQVLKQTQEQSAQVLGSAKTLIEQKIGQALEGFRQHAAEQLQTVEQNARGLSEEIAEAVGQHFNSGAEKFQQQVADAGQPVHPLPVLGVRRRRALPAREEVRLHDVRPERRAVPRRRRACQFLVLPGAVKALLMFNEWLGFDPDIRLNEWLEPGHHSAAGVRHLVPDAAGDGLPEPDRHVHRRRLPEQVAARLHHPGLLRRHHHADARRRSR